jgi:hypothetical protein
MQQGTVSVPLRFSGWVNHPMGIQMGGNNGMLYFIVGALCVAVAVGGFILFGGNMSGPSQAKAVDVKVELPKVEKK